MARAVVLGATNLGTYSSAKQRISRAFPAVEGVSLHFLASLVAGLAIATTTGSPDDKHPLNPL